MQNFRSHKKLYHLRSVDQTEYSKVALERYEKLRKYELLKLQGNKEAIILEVLGVSRATLYRWKKRYQENGLADLEERSKRPKRLRVPQWSWKQEQQVLRMRKKYPLWGKYKIAYMLRTEGGIVISVSTVGRILRYLLAQGRIKPVNLLIGKRLSRPRVFKDHAQPWKKAMKAKQAGEMVQMDHMQVELPNGRIRRHFSAICPTTKMAVYRVYRRACSSTASAFLKYVQEQLPFKVLSIQVDGGSEFMGVFEQECKTQGIQLYVLPPRSPECNGTVERSNSTAKYEFYRMYEGSLELEVLQKGLSRFMRHYNEKRPHQGLGYLTPREFYSQLNLRP